MYYKNKTFKLNNSVNNQVNNKQTDSYNHVINLQDYMLTKNLIDKLDCCININNNDPDKCSKHKLSVKKQTNTDPFYIPKNKDTLFWCFYIMKFGDVKYELLDKNIVVEKKIKIDYIDILRKNKPNLKIYKFGSIHSSENYLANEMKIDINTFFNLCVVEKINMIYISNKTYFELNFGNDTPIHIIHFFKETNKYGLELDSQDKVEHYKKNLYNIVNVEKPIKSISSYKTEELNVICQKLCINLLNLDGKKKLKKDLYQDIVQNLS